MMSSTLRFLLAVVALVLSGYSISVKAQEVDVDTDFFYACSGGKDVEVKAFLQKHPGTLHIFRGILSNALRVDAHIPHYFSF
jgi:hypothetical protein